VRERRLLPLLLRRARTAVYVRYVVLRRELELEPPERAAPAGVDVRELTAGEVERAYGRLRPDARASELSGRLGAGHRCFGAWSDGTLVAAVWIRFDAIWLPFSARPLPLPPGAAYAYDSYTRPDQRRRGVATFRSRVTCRRLRELGYTSAYAFVLGGDTPALRAATAAGYRPAGELRWLHLGSLGIEQSLDGEGRGTWSLRFARREPELPHGRAS